MLITIATALGLLCICAAACIAAQARVIHESDDHIAALNEALEEAHREVVMHREHINALGAIE